jgi:uncharacterized protein YgiM (DUF1202 family)
MADVERGGNQNINIKFMKTNYWLVLGTLAATGAVAQVNTNTLPEIPPPANAAAAPAAPESAPAPAAAPVKKAAPKHHAVRKISEPPVALVPGPATVIPEHLNVRGQAGLKGEAVGRLKSGDTVNVISQINLDKHAPDEPAQWAKISLPADTKVWVNSRYLDAATKTVTARRLNLRGGPGENYSVLGVLEKGAAVTELTTKGGWTQIAAPADAFAFVAAMYLKQEPTFVTATTPPPTATQPTPVPEANVAEAQPATTSTQPATSLTPGGAGANENQNPATTPTTVAAATPEFNSATVDTNPPPPRVVSHEGYVRSSISPVAPTAYELFDWDTGKVINYLYSPTADLDLSKYNGCRIIATGEEGMSARWASTPVLTLQKIYVTATGYPDVTKRLSSPRASQQDIRGTKPQQRR